MTITVDTYKTALSGIFAAQARMANTANNIANATTTGRLPATPGEAATSYAPTRIETKSQVVGGVTVDQFPVTPAYTPQLDESSPHADADGLVAAPNVDLAKELVDLKITAAYYRANAAVIAVQSENERSLKDLFA